MNGVHRRRSRRPALPPGGCPYVLCQGGRDQCLAFELVDEVMLGSPAGCSTTLPASRALGSGGCHDRNRGGAGRGRSEERRVGKEWRTRGEVRGGRKEDRGGGE